jgi:spore coat protein CotH
MMDPEERPMHLLHMKILRSPISILILLSGLSALNAATPTADDLFDDSVLHEMSLDVHPSDWRQLLDNFRENTYYPASLRWRGMQIDSVGIRSRGLGSRSATKPGLRVDFNRFAPGLEFLGLKSLVLDNLTQDPSMLRERLGMSMFRRMGIPAPRVAHARLMINGQYAGLYAIVEPVDKVFLKRNFKEDGGYLYEYDWSKEYRFEYLGSNPALYSPVMFNPQTRESDPDARTIEMMIRVMNQSSDQDFVSAMSQYLDLKLFLDYLAVENFIGELDGVQGDWGLNNFYLYRFDQTTLFRFIPWDKDVTFRNSSQPILKAGGNVLVRRLLSMPEMLICYLDALDRVAELAGGPEGWLEKEVNRAYSQISRAAMEDHLRPYTAAYFEENVDGLRAFAFDRARQVEEQTGDARAAMVPVE